MNSRQRVHSALQHQTPDRVPLDLGGCGQTGMHVSTVYALRQALHLDPPGTPVKVVESFQMLGEIAPDLQEALQVDVVGMGGTGNFFGFKNEGWKPWTFWDGTPVLVPELFNTTPDARGNLLMYPQGDSSVLPCAMMPNGGFYFDTIARQDEIDDEKLDVRDNLEEFEPIDDAELRFLRSEAERLYQDSERAIMLVIGGIGFGDIALVPGPTVKHPKGIRDMTEWYMSTVTRKDYIYKVFEGQCAVAMENLPRIYDAVGDLVSVAWLSGTDFGAQNNCFVSPKAFRDLYKPFYKQVNDWIHQHTPWKTFIHTCGSIQPIIPDIIDSGFDILNPVQTSAANMDAQVLKQRFGEQVTFWGGGVDTQHTLPFGTPQDVRQEVSRRLEIFGESGGFVFATVHNVQAKVPIDNLLAMYQTIHEYNGIKSLLNP